MEKDTTYVALDDSKRKIVVGVLRSGDTQPELREIANDPRQIRRLFERLKREGPVAACYVAGVSGYDLHRQLIALGVAGAVIAPALTPRRPGQRIKTDRRDAAKLVRLFRDGELTAIHVLVGWLRCFRGIDTLSAIILLAEVVDFQRFRRPRELMAYLGLVPSEYSSGECQRRGALTKAGNSHARRILVEAAWHYRHRPTIGRALASRTHGQPDEVVAQAWRAQQRLHRPYRHLLGHGKRTPVAVAAVARGLVGVILAAPTRHERSEEHTSELQSRLHILLR